MFSLFCSHGVQVLTKLKTFFRVLEAWCHCTFRKDDPVSHAGHQISQSPMQVSKSPTGSLLCRSSNLLVSCAAHQISQSPVRVIKSPSLPCSSPNLPVFRAGHQISQSPVQLTKSPSLPCRSSNLSVSHVGHQTSQSLHL